MDSKNINLLDSIAQKVDRHILREAFFCMESACTIALCLLLAGLSYMKFLWFQNLWWVWLVLGVVGVAAIIWSRTSDAKTKHELTTSMLKEHVDEKSQLKSPDLKMDVQQAWEHRNRVLNELIAGVGYNAAAQVQPQLDTWMLRMSDLARQLDQVPMPPALDQPNIEIGLPVEEAHESTVISPEVPAMQSPQMAAKAQLEESLAHFSDLSNLVRKRPRFRDAERMFVNNLRSIVARQVSNLENTARSVEALAK
jgi:hypothetical protein